jgi:hypothetical protein
MFEPCSGFLNQEYGNLSVLRRIIVSESWGVFNDSDKRASNPDVD